MIRILWGTDEFSLSEMLEKIKKSIGDRTVLELNMAVFDGQKLTPNQLQSVINAAPFLAEKRLIIVNGLLSRFNQKERTGQTKKESAQSNNGQQSKEDNQQTNNEHRGFADLINAMPETTVLVLVDNTRLLNTNPLLKALTQKADVQSFQAKRGIELQRWIQEHVTANGGRISPGATRLLAQLAASNLRDVLNEIKKLTLFAAGRTINEQDIKAVVSEAHEFDIFSMVDAIFELKAGLAEQILQRLLEKGVEPGNIINMLSRQVRIIILAKELKSQKKSEAEIRDKLGIKWEFIWRKVLNQMGRYSMERLKHFYRQLLQTDLSIKTGKYSEELALNMLIAELCESRLNTIAAIDK